MDEFSLRDCLIPELLKWKIDFRILRYKNGDKSLPESLIVHYKYINICRVDCTHRRITSNACYHVVWHTEVPFGKSQYYSRACELIPNIRKAIDAENRGEKKMDKKMYVVTNMEFKSSPYTYDEIDFTVNVMRQSGAIREDADKIKAAIESIGEKCDYHGGFTTWRNEYEKERDKFDIKDVIFNNPATIVFWEDGTKTVVKAENEEFDPEKGLAMAIAKKALGNNYGYYDIFKKYVGRYEKKQKKGGK